MISMNRLLVISFALFCAIAPISACKSKGGGDTIQTSQSSGITHRSFLNDKQIVSDVPPVSSATGTAAVTLDAATGILTGSVTLSNITTTVTTVNINNGDVGTNGLLVVSLTETPAGSGTWIIPQTAVALTAAQTDRFKAAGFYIIVETFENPSGEIRGQLLSYSDNIQAIFEQNCVSCHKAGGAASVTGLFLGQGEAYSGLVNQPATQSPGTRVVPFDADNSVLLKRIRGIGVNRMPPGGPYLSLTDENLIKVWIIMGAITDSDVFPVPPAPRTIFTRQALLDSRQIVAAAPVVSSMKGTATVTLNTATNRLIGTVNLTDPARAATAVHINDGDVGSTGALVVSLSETPAGSGVWQAPDTALTAAQMDRLKKAGFYVSVVTTANPNGEIRGQLLSYADNIQTIFDSNCTGCHYVLGPASFTGLLLLSADSYASLVNRPAAQSTGARVVPSDANNSVLFQRITGTGFSSVVGSLMPPPESRLPALSQRDQDLIKTWINMGAIDDKGVVQTPSPIPARQSIRNTFLNAAQVVPAVTVSSAATATATFTLSEATGQLTGTVVISNVTPGKTISSVHINNGYADTKGAALAVALTETPIGSGVFTISSTVTILTPTQMNIFIAGGLYIGVDTTVLGITSEEIRGQIQTFKDDVQPLFTARCVKCHNAGILFTRGQSYATLVNQPATQSVGTRVIPFDAANSVLYNRLTGNGFPTGRMPADGPPYLTVRETSIIKAWISMGAPND